ncbi:MhpC Predicted hydrolases or acyltransferases (alpha/beta hydrolase superfamily) [Acidimicrobiia bacterium]
MTTIVLTHGAFHGSWCFEPLVAELEARGVTTALVDLPLTDLTEDAAAVTAVLDTIDGPVILLGHSYGGAVVTVAGNHPSVERLVYLTALGPDAGELGSGGPMTIGEQFLTTMRVDDDGLPFIDPEFAAKVFYPDIDPTEAARWATKLRSGNTGGAVIVEKAAWRSTPSTYVVCTDDPILLVDGQRAVAERMGADVVEMPGDHSPMVARPAELADILVALLE